MTSPTPTRRPIDPAAPIRPTFLLIGAQRAGTTSFARLLAQHPEIAMPARKELHHFDLWANLRRGPAAYAAHFAGCDGRAVGEATPNYLGVLGAPAPALERLADAGVTLAAHPEVVPDPATEVHRVLPDLDLVVLLRDPVARALSSWRHQIRMGELSPRAPFREVCGRHGIVTMGFYHHHLTRWLEHYSARRLLALVVEEDIVGAAAASIRRAYGHVGVDPDVEPVGLDERANARASDLELHLRAIRPGLHDRIRRFAPIVRRVDWPRIRPTPDDLDLLVDLHRPEIAPLEELLGRSLDVWTRRWV